MHVEGRHTKIVNGVIDLEVMEGKGKKRGRKVWRFVFTRQQNLWLCFNRIFLGKKQNLTWKMVLLEIP